MERRCRRWRRARRKPVRPRRVPVAVPVTDRTRTSSHRRPSTAGRSHLTQSCSLLDRYRPELPRHAVSQLGPVLEHWAQLTDWVDCVFSLLPLDQCHQVLLSFRSSLCWSWRAICVRQPSKELGYSRFWLVTGTWFLIWFCWTANPVWACWRRRRGWRRRRRRRPAPPNRCGCCGCSPRCRAYPSRRPRIPSTPSTTLSAPSERRLRPLLGFRRFSAGCSGLMRIPASLFEMLFLVRRRRFLGCQRFVPALATISGILVKILLRIRPIQRMHCIFLRSLFLERPRNVPRGDRRKSPNRQKRVAWRTSEEREKKTNKQKNEWIQTNRIVDDWCCVFLLICAMLYVVFEFRVSVLPHSINKTVSPHSNGSSIVDCFFLFTASIKLPSLSELWRHFGFPVIGGQWEAPNRFRRWLKKLFLFTASIELPSLSELWRHFGCPVIGGQWEAPNRFRRWLNKLRPFDEVPSGIEWLICIRDRHILMGF